MNRLGSLVALALLIALAACKSDPPAPTPATSPAPATPPAKPTPKPTPVIPAPAPLPPTLTEAAARATLDRWLAAQNAGDFAAYEATYAPRFFGIKRAGERTSRFDRAGWMKDRRRMFGAPMTVTAADVRITPGPATARIQFTQTWASADYRDVGPKQLVLGLHDGAALINREEMLRSTVLGPAPRALVDEGPAPVRFVRMLDAPYVMLGEAVETDAPPRVLARGRPHVVAAAAPAGSPHVGRAVALYGPNGRRCTGEIAEVVVMGLVIPHFGAVQSWNGELDGSGAKADPAQVAASLWQMSEGGRYLAGRLDKTANDCAGALYARLEGPEAPAAKVWRPSPVSPAQQNAALAVIRETGAWREIQQAYVDQGSEEQAGGPGPWDAAGVARASVEGFTGPGGRSVVVVNLDAGLGCGGFGGGLWLAFAVDGARMEPIGEPRTQPFSPAGALDRGGPLPALIGVEGYSGDSALFEPEGAAYTPAGSVTVLDLDCPC